MERELTISQYRTESGIGLEILTSFLFFAVFSGLTMLGIWIFKFSDHTSPSKTGTKKNDEYFNELGIPGLVVTYLFLAGLTTVVYHHHLKPVDNIDI